MSIITYFFNIRTETGVWIFETITNLASPLAAIMLMVIITTALFLHKQKIIAMLEVAGFLLAEGITAFLKFIIHRDRPDVLFRAVSETSFSFPSGHATTAAFIFGLMGYLAFKHFKSKLSRAFVVCFVVLVVAIIDFSRLYLGVHYLSDVLAGNLVGLFALGLVVLVQKKWFKIPLLSNGAKQRC